MTNVLDTNERKALAWEKLLKMFHKEFVKRGYSGLCAMIQDKFMLYDITYHERNYLDQSISEDVRVVRFRTYLFEPGDVTNRIRYINDKIETLKELL